MRRNIMRDAIVGELERYGVAWREQPGGKHQRIVIDAPGAPFIPYSRGGNARDGAITRVIRAQVRRMLRTYGGLS
jgi:hypothetical protein